MDNTLNAGMNYIYSGCYYLVCVLSYILSGMLFNKRMPVRRFFAGIGLGIILCYVSVTGHVVPSLLSAAVAVFTVFLMISASMSERIRDTFIFYLITECVVGSIECVLSLLTDATLFMSYTSFLSRLCSLCIFIVIYLVRKNVKSNTVPVAPERNTEIKHHFLTLLILSVIMMFGIAGMRLLSDSTDSSFMRNFLRVLTLLSYLAIGGIVITFFQANAANHRIREMLQQQQLLNTMQEEYYDTLLEKESDTRKYRHDMNNHFLVLQELLASGEPEQSLQYLSSMKKTLDNITERIPLTGNTLIDTLTAYFIKRLPDRNLLKIEGVLPAELPFDMFSVTVIYSNLLQNAVEAVLNDTGTSENKFIHVDARITEKYFHITITNSFSDEKKTHYISGRTELKYHGYGLSNVRNTVATLGGTYTASSENQIYTAEVSLPVAV